jgi:hypothetical protein
MEYIFVLVGPFFFSQTLFSVYSFLEGSTTSVWKESYPNITGKSFIYFSFQFSQFPQSCSLPLNVNQLFNTEFLQSAQHHLWATFHKMLFPYTLRIVNIITSYNEGYTFRCLPCSEIVVKANSFIERALGFSMHCLRDTVFIMALLSSYFPTDAQRKPRTLMYPKAAICKVGTEYL